MTCSDSLPLIPPRFVSFAWRYHPRVCFRLSHRARRQPVGQEVISPDTSHAACEEWKRQGLPGSWGTRMYVPCSSTPAGPRAPGHYRASVLPSAFWTTSAPAISTISGLTHTARTFAVYASQDGSPHHHARLASGCWPALPDGIDYPLGPNERFQLSHPPFPGFAWRNQNQCMSHLSICRPGYDTAIDHEPERVSVQSDVYFSLDTSPP